MAIPTYINHGAGASGAAAITPPLPAGLAVDDVLLLYLETCNEAVSITNHNNGLWALVDHSGQGTGGVGSSTGIDVYWSRYNGVQGSPTAETPGDHISGYISAFRGVKATGDPWNVKAISSEVTDDTSLSADGVTTTVADCLIVVAAVLMDDNPDFGTWVNANLSSLTNRLNYSTSVGNDGRLMTVTGGNATADDIGATTNTLTASSRKAMMVIALEPAGPAEAQSKTDPLGLVDDGTAELFHDYDLLGLTDSITWQRTVSGQGASSVVITTTGAGDVQDLNQGSGSSSIVVTISATGKATNFGTGSSSIIVSAAATGQRTALGQGSSNVVVTTSAASQTTHFGTGASNTVVTTSATGEATSFGTGSSNIVVTTTGFGTVEGNNQGAGTSSIVVTISATGQRTAKRTGTCSVTVNATATGFRRVHGTGSSSIVVTCTARGTHFATGAANIVVSALGVGQIFQPGFWNKNPVAFIKVGPGDDPPWN